MNGGKAECTCGAFCLYHQISCVGDAGFHQRGSNGTNPRYHLHAEEEGYHGTTPNGWSPPEGDKCKWDMVVRVEDAQ